MRLGIRALALSIALSGTPAVASAAAPSLLDLSIEELMEVSVASPASLGPMRLVDLPSRVTRIDRRSIELSGARSLNELLETLVPGLQWLYHSFGMSHLGMRGAISNRDDKYLLLVNGVSLNHVSHAGAYTERDLPMLGDIDHVDVVHGAGSAVNGLGAVAMTINVVTRGVHDDACEVSGGLGAIERFSRIELACAQRFADGQRVRYYVGTADYRGADNADAPLTFSTALRTRWGDAVAADGDSSALTFTADRAQYRGKLPLKLHLDWSDGSRRAQLRFTRGGEMTMQSVNQIALRPVGNTGAPNAFPYQANEFGYAQWLGSLEQKIALGADTAVLSFQGVVTDYEERAPAFATQFSNREDRYTLGGLWQGQRGSHAVSIGASAELRRLGLRSPGFPRAVASSELFPDVMPRWNTRVLALFGEDQWQIDETWRLLAGVRAEDHTYLGLTWSPRLSLSRPLFDDGQLTLTVARAQRGGFEDELYAAHGAAVDNQVETQDSIELLYRQPTTLHGYVEASLFAARLDAIGFVQSGVNTVNSRLVGEQRHRGAEVSWRGRWSGAEWTVSHAWLGLDSFRFEPGITDTQITAAPNGYGSALNGYAGHLSKVSARGQVGNASEWWLGLVWYHNFDGTRDRLRLLDDRRVASGLAPQATDGGAAVGGPNRYLHAGWLWRASPAVEVGAHAYNVLGLYEERWNKRNYLNNVSQYRVQAPAVALSLRWRFN